MANFEGGPLMSLQQPSRRASVFWWHVTNEIDESDVGIDELPEGDSGIRADSTIVWRDPSSPTRTHKESSRQRG